ncbi:MAG: T9SS type A sorting domain-containing protein [Ignavibacteriae bacterium]|nr:T9SS type A sorting domain-containing protein [Ignavibacteriota bacterium]
MAKILWAILIFMFFTNLLFAQKETQNRNIIVEKLQSKVDVKATEIEKDILKLQYPNGKLLYKNIGDYKKEYKALHKTTYSPNFDSTVIDLNAIDTSLYSNMYSFWQEVPIGNFRTLLVGDINNNGFAELYGQMKDYTTPHTDIVSYEMNAQGNFNFAHKYDINTVIARSIFDVDGDTNNELVLLKNFNDTIINWNVNQFLYYKKSSDLSLATELSFSFQPKDSNNQQNDNLFGHWDGDDDTDQIFILPSNPLLINIYEYNHQQNNFIKIFEYDYYHLDLFYSGFSIGDFDQDGKTEFFCGSIHGKILSIENCGNDCYAPNYKGMVETYNAYLCASTNDLDGNGKKEIWIGGDAFFDGVAITRITIFEANGNNSYHAVGKIDLKGIFSTDAGNIQVIDVDKDGKEEVLFGLDMTVIILKFVGSLEQQKYEVFYYKRHNWENNYMGYYGANLYNMVDDERDDERQELLINMWDIKSNVGIKWFNRIYKPNFLVDIKEESNTIPVDFKLYPVYPNPFNPQTTIKFDITESSKVSVKIYNIIGEEIITLLEKVTAPGNYSLSWEARDYNGKLVPSGIYLIRLTTNNYSATVKSILLK